MRSGKALRLSRRSRSARGYTASTARRGGGRGPDAAIVLAAAVLGLLPAGCERKISPQAASSAAPAATRARAPVQAPAAGRFEASCAACHPSITASWSRHGMARALAKVDPGAMPGMPDGAWIENPSSGQAYRIERSDGEAWIAERPPQGPWLDLPPRRMRLARTLGAGIRDTTVVAEEEGRLYFAPLEYFTGHGWELSPAEHDPHAPRLEFPITTECYACHTSDPLPRVYPRNDLGSFDPRPIGCAACHGPGEEHVRRFTQLLPGAPPPRDPAIVNPALLDRDRRMDICARCHAQGDARVELQPEGAAPFLPGDDLFARRITFVAARHGDDFGFVSQTDRLVLSRCFQESGDLSCTTCHDPHVSSAETAVERYEKACRGCHEPQACSRDRDLRVAAVAPERHLEGSEGCVACHMRRAAPFDLPLATVTDHWIRRWIPVPRAVTSPRARESLDGELRRLRYDPGALPATPQEAQWESGALAMALVHTGHATRALALFDAFAPPGSETARAPSAPAGFAPLERLPMFHFVRALALETAGRLDEAERAYRDALLLDPSFPEARVNLALRRLDRGDLAGARGLLEPLAAEHPKAEKVWNALARVAEAQGDDAAVRDALAMSVRVFPHDAVAAFQLATRRRAARDAAGAYLTFRLALLLDPSLPGIWKHFGWAAAAFGDFRNARGAIEQALRLDPNDIESREALQHLPAEALR